MIYIGFGVPFCGDWDSYSPQNNTLLYTETRVFCSLCPAELPNFAGFILLNAQYLRQTLDFSGKSWYNPENDQAHPTATRLHPTAGTWAFA
jgi:hypothetical protein